jgi:2-polyprenyl-3-methyl-5-hydroxy-6-metoxy-1,4-benzoquinol methylase
MRLGYTSRAKGRRCPSGPESEPTIRTAGGNQPVTSGGRVGPGMRRLDGPAPWDIVRPQPAILRLAREGAFAGAVLDAGCGTGENALHVASLGLHVLGVDVADTALSIAREKAAARGVDADFVVADALHLDRLGPSV